MLCRFFCTPGPDKPKTCLALALDEQASLGAQVRQNLHLHSKSHEKQRIGFTHFFVHPQLTATARRRWLVTSRLVCFRWLMNGPPAKHTDELGF